MASIAGTGFRDFCYQHKWKIGTPALLLPISTALVCYFKKEWVTDPSTEVPGIACAILLNTAVCTSLTAYIQKYWSDYWDRKYKAATQVSQEVEAVQNSRKQYEQAQHDLEEAHTAIKEIKKRLESATRDKARKVETANEAFIACKGKSAEALRVRNEFITSTVTPAIKGLENKKISKLLDEESKVKDSPIYLIINPIFSNLKELKEILTKSRTDNKTQLNIPNFITILRETFTNLNQLIYEIEKDDNSLIEKTKTDEAILQRLNKTDLPAAQEALLENSRIKNTEGAQKKYLEDLLEQISNRMKDLDREMEAINFQAAKLAYDRAGHTCKCNEAELNSIKKHSSNEPIEAQGAVQQFLGLKTYDKLFDELKALQTEEQQAKAKTQEKKKELDTITAIMRKDLQEQLDLLGRNLFTWLEDFDKKRAELVKKKEKALEDNNQPKKSGFGGILPAFGTTAADPELKKLDQQRKIDSYFSDLLKTLDSCKLQYKKPNSPDDSRVKPSLVLATPDWDESEAARSKAFEKFLALTQSIQNQDSLLPLIIKLRNLLNPPQINYDDLSFTRLFIRIFKSNLHLELKEDFKKTFLSFKEAIDIYLACLKKQEDLGDEIETVNAEYQRRDRKMKELQQFQNTLQAARDRAKEQHDDKKTKHFKNRGEYDNLKEQKDDTIAEKKKIEKASETIDAVIERNRQAIASLRTEIDNTNARIAKNKKQQEINKVNLSILRDEKGKLETFTVTLTVHAPSILDQLHSMQKEFQDALDATETAAAYLAKKQEKLKSKTSDLTDAKDTDIKKRKTKLEDLQRIDKEVVVDSIQKLKKAEYNSARLNVFLSVIDKCQSAIDLFRKKYANPKDTSQKTLEMRLAAHNCTKKMLHAKTELALKKQVNNLHLQRARLSELTKKEAENASNTCIADVHKYQLRVCQLDRHQAELDWRVASIEHEPDKRARIEMLLQTEEQAIYQFFCTKFKLPSSKGREEGAHHQTCDVQALIAFIDLFLVKMHVDLIRHNVRPKKKPEAIAPKEPPLAASPKEQPVAAAPKEKSEAAPSKELPVAAALKEKPNVITMLLGHMKKENGYFNSFLTKSDKLQNPVVWLTEALNQDQKAHKNPLELPTLTMFFQELRRIVKTIDVTNIHDRKIPLIEAKIDLLNHLTNKPYKEDDDYENNFEAYQNARNDFRTKKYQKRIIVEELEKKYIEGKAQFKKYEVEQRDASKFSYRNIDTIIEYPAVETVSYLVPVVILVALYFIKINKVFSLFNIILSDPASITIWEITTVLYCSLQILSPRVSAVFKKAISQS